MPRHQMMPRINKPECQTPIVARKRQAPEDKGTHVKQVKREQEEQRPRPYRRSARLSSKNAPEPPTCIHNREQSTKPNHKRPCEDQAPSSLKRPRLSTSLAIEYIFVEKKRDIASWKKVDLIGYWCKNNRWPIDYFEAQPGENMSHLLAKKKSTASVRCKNSTSSLATGSNTPTDQESRDGKSAKYRSATYETLLATKGSFMAESELEVTENSKEICRTLLDEKQMIPEGTIFQNDRFRKACQKLQTKNESRVVQDISRLIVPSAETFATCGAKNLECLTESVNEQWASSIAFCGPRPQPDYAVGFSRSAFTEDQLKKFEPFLGYDLDSYSSFFLATFYMYFPFLTSEVKGTVALDIADRQNAHSMTLAVRGVVELFKLVGRKEEVNREILAFSISHDHRTVRIYGHYAVIEGNKTSFYRHPIRMFDFTELDGREKWSAYTFTRNVYEKWAPDHLRKIHSAIDEIPPGVNFDVSQSEFELSQSSVSSFLNEDNSQEICALSAEVTLNTSFTQQTQVLKRPRRQK
ncbi:hypothetical protein BDBG_00212 [Blastomyces gilchristii SLH14081]|uniref:DUF7924 domain-containing protein n=1 Tax=Blastomyces gilchristii (strain SLH14081) TaxID=559298 RepID=A0A179U984_BLAGS|nr:uncharacterized protein BDBG_00212 [Blastomyces gilchristii SLH14081]OAT03501.1 hypothetical protein BDBG_00212 [Blastomyces gilchristii SLH14081]